jgi:nucleotide-binding universal stress UspA family protein
MTDVFSRVLCAVDDSDAGVAASRVAARVTLPDGVLTLVSVDDTSQRARGAIWGATSTAPPDRRAASALRRAEVAGLERGFWPRRREGDPAAVVLEEAVDRDATLLVIGSHGYRRATGIAFGLVGSRLVHDAPCPVLVAREPAREPWPRSIVVGLDGSHESAAATDAARELAGRFDASLRAVACTDGHVDLDAAREIEPQLEVLSAGPIEALAELSETADMVAVGSRGLRGVRALGSVSERLAHRSRCSVLIVRAPPRR